MIVININLPPLVTADAEKPNPSAETPIDVNPCEHFGVIDIYETEESLALKETMFEHSYAFGGRSHEYFSGWCQRCGAMRVSNWKTLDSYWMLVKR